MDKKFKVVRSNFSHDFGNQLVLPCFFEKFITKPTECNLNKVHERVSRIKQNLPEMKNLLSCFEEDVDRFEYRHRFQDTIDTMYDAIKKIHCHVELFPMESEVPKSCLALAKEIRNELNKLKKAKEQLYAKLEK